MPFGEYPYSIDDKGRVVMPPAFREFWNDGMILTRGLEGCLYLFALSGWKRVEEQLKGLPLTDAGSRAFVRFFYSGASKARLDAQSRLSGAAAAADLCGPGQRRGGRRRTRTPGAVESAALGRRHPGGAR